MLGEIRAATITYRAIARSHLLANTEADKNRRRKPSEEVDRQRREGSQKRYEPMINSAEERTFYNEFQGRLE